MGNGLAAVSAGATGLSPHPNGPYGDGETLQQIHPQPQRKPAAPQQPAAARRKRAAAASQQQQQHQHPPQQSVQPPRQRAQQQQQQQPPQQYEEEEEEEDEIPVVESQRRIDELSRLRGDYKQVFDQQMAALKETEEQLPEEGDESLRDFIKKNREAIKLQFVNLTTDAVRRASSYSWATPVPVVPALAQPTALITNLTSASALPTVQPPPQPPPAPPPVDQLMVSSALASMPPPPATAAASSSVVPRRPLATSHTPRASAAYGGGPFRQVSLEYVKQQQAAAAAAVAAAIENAPTVPTGSFVTVDPAAAAAPPPSLGGVPLEL